MSINNLQIQEKLNKINSAIKQLAENKNKQPKSILINQLLQLKEAKNSLTKKLTETIIPTTVSYKGNLPDKVLRVDPLDIETIHNLKIDPTIDHATMGTVKLKEQEGRGSYTAEESEAVGNYLIPTLETAIRDTKGELASKPVATGEVNGVTIHAIYGHKKGEDHFKFILEPETGILYLKSGKEKLEVAPFEVTEANSVMIDPEIDLENKLKDLLVKYVSEPITQKFTDNAIDSLSPDESQINEFISKRKQALKETLTPNTPVKTYIKDFEKSKAPQFKGKSKEKIRQMAIAASYNKDETITKEELDEIMLEAYVEVLREQEGNPIPELPKVQSEPATPKPEKKQIPYIVKYELGKVIDSLFGSSHMDFVDRIQLAVPNPSEFQVFLKNGQSFYLKWMGKSPSDDKKSEEAGIEHLGQEIKGAFMAEIESKEYYLGSLPQYEQALDKLGDLLKNGIITQGEVPGEAAFGGSAGAESTGGSAGGGSETGAGTETFPEVPEEAPTNAAGTGPEVANAFEEEPTKSL